MAINSLTVCTYVALHAFVIFTRVFSYTEQPMESDRICHPLRTKKHVKLSDAEDAAVIVKPVRMFDYGIEREKLCKFVFKSSRHMQLFAVVQSMDFRRNGTKCIDYIQFKEDGRISNLFCGKVYLGRMESNRDLSDDANPDFIHPEFISRNGEIETRIYISKEPLLPEQKLDISVIYTPFRDCTKLKDNSNYRPNDSSTCIWDGYYCDGYKNCAEGFCQDEKNCKNEIVSIDTGTKVTVGAVTTLFLFFLLLIVCLWTCRKQKKLCWSTDCAGPMVSSATDHQMDPQPSGGSNSQATVPTAPMLQEMSTRHVQDKDLPPSYDSLFPDQAMPTVT